MTVLNDKRSVPDVVLVDPTTGLPISTAHRLPVDVQADISATIGDFALANAADPVWVEGATTEASVDLQGYQRTRDKDRAAQGSATSGQQGKLVQGAATAAAPSYTEGTINPLNMDLHGGARTILHDVDGAPVSYPLAVDVSALETQVGEVQDSPTANTLLARLKDLLTGIVLAAGGNIIGKAKLVDASGADLTYTNPVAVTVVQLGEVQVSPTANTVLDRLKTIATNVGLVVTALGGVVLAAGNAAIGTFRFTPAVSSVFSETVINITASGTTPLIAGTVDQIGRLYRVVLVATSAVNLTFEDDTTPLTGPIYLGAGGSFVLDFDGEPWFTTTAGNALNLSADANAQVSGRAYWIKS